MRTHLYKLPPNAAGLATQIVSGLRKWRLAAVTLTDIVTGGATDQLQVTLTVNGMVIWTVRSPTIPASDPLGEMTMARGLQHYVSTPAGQATIITAGLPDTVVDGGLENAAGTVTVKFANGSHTWFTGFLTVMDMDEHPLRARLEQLQRRGIRGGGPGGGEL